MFGAGREIPARRAILYPYDSGGVAGIDKLDNIGSDSICMRAGQLGCGQECGIRGVEMPALVTAKGLAD